MKFTSNYAFLLLAFSSGALAETSQTQTRRLKGGSGKSSSSRGGQNVPAGDPATFEFLVTRNECLNFDPLRKGQKAELEGCDRATEFVYREDLLIQVDDIDLCLEANFHDDTVTIEKCDSGNTSQEWVFIRVPTRNSRTVYRLRNIGTGLFLEANSRDDFILARDNDEAQWFVGPDNEFFETFGGRGK